MTPARAILDWQAGIAEHSARALDAAADIVLARLERDGILFAGGAGHSLAAVCEAFYRAGGLVPVRPLYHPRLLPLVDAWDSTMA
ncbi:MAG TPA: SIS domain-containing protein, partial [Capillimicrobium sp.]